MLFRKKLNYPPYTFLVSVKIISNDYEIAKNESNKVAIKLREELCNSEILGPSIGSTFKIKNTYRFGITIKYKKEEKLYPFLKKLLDYYKSNIKVKLDVDFNPISW